MSTNEIIAMYQELEQFLKSAHFDDDLKKVLTTSNPKYLQNLEKRRRDIERSDHGIVIAGMIFIFKLLYSELCIVFITDFSSAEYSTTNCI